MEYREEVFNTVIRMVNCNLISGSSGNVSVRVKGEEKVAITPTSLDYYKMKKEDIIVINFNQDIIVGELAPSVESAMHLAVYKAREDVGAVIHSHSIFATVLAVLHKPILPIVEELVPYIGGEVEVANYGQAGSEELAKNAVESLKDKSAVLLANHGALCCGKNLNKAFKICELVERTAKIYFYSLLIGTPKLLPPEVVELEKEFYKYVKEM